MAKMYKFCYTIFLVIIYLNCSLASNANYNVQSYGAKPDGKTDSTKGFLKAWVAACSSTSRATIYVPQGKYLLGSISFEGQNCNSNDVTFKIDGTIIAPSDYNVIGKSENWIRFMKVTGVTIVGGTLDAQGVYLWRCKTSGKHCPRGATTLAFYHSNNVVINGLSSENSQMFHILIYGSKNAKLTGVKISAPGDSPNTDGIHIQSSSVVSILNSHVGTGDDCVSIGPGNSHLWIENIVCGPGHGISIGSLGWQKNEAGVENVTVKTATFSNTQNGFRVKTWARPNNGFVRKIVYQNSAMNNVQNPIIIDQNYCPSSKNCPRQGSGVKISDVRYETIHGTSATEVAMKLDCSSRNPCSGIMIKDVNLKYKGQNSQASCSNVQFEGSVLANSVNLASCV